MKKKLLVFAVLCILLFVIAIVSASPLIPADDRAKARAQAPEHSPVIDENFALERIDFIHYVKPPSTIKKPAADKCYKLMGVKWLQSPVRYTINPLNGEGLTSGYVTETIRTSAEVWDQQTSRELFNDLYTVDGSVAYGSYDGKNAIAFGPYGDPNVIAVTSVWYTRLGKQIVEFDILFNDRYIWGDATSTDYTRMDLQNIATHELGHAVGMGDVYTTTCSPVTMYGYSFEGDTEKRSLELPDIVGLQTMYGA